MMSFRPAQLLFALATVWPCAGVAAAEAKPALEDGLAVTFKLAAGGTADHTVRPHFMLYVPAGEAPSPFIKPGPFTAKWEGVIHLDLRDRFIFQAELNGSLKLELNGNPVMEATGTGGMTDPTKRIRSRRPSRRRKKGTPFFDCTGRRPTTATNRSHRSTSSICPTRPWPSVRRCGEVDSWRRNIGVSSATPPMRRGRACRSWRWTRPRLKGLARGEEWTGWPTGC